jgi:hypothetical protein
MVDVRNSVLAGRAEPLLSETASRQSDSPIDQGKRTMEEKAQRPGVRHARGLADKLSSANQHRIQTMQTRQKDSIIPPLLASTVYELQVQIPHQQTVTIHVKAV